MGLSSGETHRLQSIRRRVSRRFTRPTRASCWISAQHLQKMCACFVFARKLTISDLVSSFIIIRDPIFSGFFQTVLLFSGINPFDTNGPPHYP